MATIVAQAVSESGITPVYTATEVGGDLVDNGGNTFLHFINAGESTITITVAAQITSVENEMYGDLTKANATLSLEAGVDGFIGPFTTGAYNDTNNQISITYSSVTSLTVAALYLN